MGDAVSPRIGALCAGYAGLDMAVQAVLGGELVWYAEKDPAASKVLAHRFPGVPNLGDITEIDWAQVEPVDIVTAGFPCQDLSLAGRRAGLVEGTRSGLWFHIVKALAVLQPGLVVLENVRGLLSAKADNGLEPEPSCMGDGPDVPVLRALGAVLGDLAGLGLDAEWHGLRAADVGACHGRFRECILAWPAADSPSDRQDEGRSESAWILRRLDAPERRPGAAADAGGTGLEVGAVQPHGPQQPATERGGRDAADAASADPDSAAGRLVEQGSVASGSPQGAVLEAGRGIGRGSDTPAWGVYEPAIRRWELTIGRPAPAPTEPGTKGQPRLSPCFVEFMMGLPAGWVTDIHGITRNDQLRILGNGVVPQWGEAVLRILLERAFGWRAAA